MSRKIVSRKVSKFPPRFKVVIGIDEVGRGPIAGPVAVGACALLVPQSDHRLKHMKDFRDSKQLSHKQREEWFVKICRARDEGLLAFSVSFVSAAMIDRGGLAPAIRRALGRSLAHVTPASGHVAVRVLLDGGLKAPAAYTDQTTIIKGDEKELAIALASIASKVLRDRRMVVYSKKYPHHGLEVHKGYGTRAHYVALASHGLTPLHRRSFLKNFRP